MIRSPSPRAGSRARATPRTSQAFDVYLREEICLTITGIGKCAMAAGVAYTLARMSAAENPILLNIGIAGHAVHDLGSVFLAGKIIDAETLRNYYPPLLFSPPCPVETVRTQSRPQLDYTETHLHDMEASAFYETAVRFSTGELVHCLKIVSDNRLAPAANVQPKLATALIAGQLRLWLAEKLNLTPKGEPFAGAQGKWEFVWLQGDGISFEQLVKTYADDVTPRALLDELLRVNAAHETDDGYVRLINRTYVPTPLDPVGLERLGNVVNYFIDTVDFNLQKRKQGEGRFERYAITMQGLSPPNFKRFDKLVREKGQELLEILDDWLGQDEIKGGHKLSTTESIRSGVGIFHFVEKNPTIGSDDHLVTGTGASGDTEQTRD